MNVLAKHEKIIELYESNSCTITELARKFSMSTRQVNNILEKHGIAKSRRPISTEPISDLHKSIGDTFFYYRNMMGLGYNDIAEDTLMSSKRVAAIERGLHDISVTDLKKLADYFKIDLMEIVSNYENKFNKQ